MILVAGFHLQSQGIGELQQWHVEANRRSAFYAALRDLPGLMEFVYLGTCNRCELYAVTGPDFEFHKLMETWSRFCPEPPPSLRPALLLENHEAMRHLFRVASSLDSLVVGETEILGQVKRAYLEAYEFKATGPLFNKFFQRALASAKRIRTETGLGKNPVSVATVAVKLAEKIFGDFRSIQAMILGTGQMGCQVAEYLSKREVGSLWLSNRSSQSAVALAQKFKAGVVPYDQWTKKMEAVDVVLTCVHSRDPLLTQAMLREHCEKRQGRRLCLIDLGVPRNVECPPRDIEGVYLYNLEDLKEIAQANLQLRQKEIILAEQQIESDLSKLLRQIPKTDLLPLPA